jgi:DnaK suppressor protein
MNRMHTYEEALAERCRPLLAERARKFAESLVPAGPPPEAAVEVADFKDLAANDAFAGIADAQALHAVHELDEIRAALHRMDHGTYGICLDCGDEIAERRMLAVPMARYCASCQEAHERLSRGHP